MQLFSLLGSLFLLVSYILLTLEKIKVGFTFYLLNLIGCIILAITLWFGQFNLGSFVLQLFFAIVSIIGILKKNMHG